VEHLLRPTPPHRATRRFRLPTTHLGFPVEAPPRLRAPGPGAGDGARHQRGIALIIAIMIISVMMLFTTDLILSSQVNMSLATTNRDNAKGEFLAKSAFNIALMLITADFAYDLFNAQQNPKAGLSDGLGDMWSAMNGLPIGGETLDMLSTFQASSSSMSPTSRRRSMSTSAPRAAAPTPSRCSRRSSPARPRRPSSTRRR
jgi:hypothetical protein